MKIIQGTQQHLASNTVGNRVLFCIKGAVRPALKTGVWILTITVPVSFLVLILKTTGILYWIGKALEPFFALFNLPGESALVFATACFLNIYSCIAIMQTLGITGRVVTILALMCLICHNLPVESAVQKRCGSSFWAVVGVRLAAAFAGAFILNLLLPADIVQAAAAGIGAALPQTTFVAEFNRWWPDMLHLCIKIMVLITLLMILQQLLEEFGVTRFLSRLLKYPLMALGVPGQAAFLWIVANTLGLAFGAGVLIDQVDRGKLSRKHADILNYHIAISHSLLEDTLLFVAIGVTAGWIIFPRVLIAGVVVWIKRLGQKVMGKD